MRRRICALSDGDHSSLPWLALGAGVFGLWLLLVAAAANADPKVAYRESGEGFRIGKKIRVLDLADGSVVQFTDDWLREGRPSWGPGGRQIAAAGSRHDNDDIFIARAGRSARTWLTDHPAGDAAAAWSPDGRRIAFASGRDKQSQVYVIDTDGTNLRRVTSDLWMSGSPSWSPDGSKLAYTSSDGWNFVALRILDLATGRTTRLTSHDAQRSGPAWSPDGEFIAYHVHDPDLREFHIEVMTVDRKDSWRLTEGIGSSSGGPAWTPDGRVSFSTGDWDRADIAVTDFRGGAIEFLTDSPTVKAGAAWYIPRYFSVQPSAAAWSTQWGWLKRQ